MCWFLEVSHENYYCVCFTKTFIALDIYRQIDLMVELANIAKILKNS